MTSLFSSGSCSSSRHSAAATSDQLLPKSSTKKPSATDVEEESDPISASSSTDKDNATTIEDFNADDAEANSSSKSFSDLGLCDWVCNSATAMGYKRPTPIQSRCIPAILQGRDVMGCAETGSGKTAAFALPILQDLSQDPYGIFCVVLTPTRELAMQISEQFVAFGSTFGVRVCLIIGGKNIMEQRLALAKLPHIVIATPGRLRHHIDSATPPKLNKTKYIVLDEADRLLCDSFHAELGSILSCMPQSRRTLIFSATLTSSLTELSSLSMKNALRFNLNRTAEQGVVPSQIAQEYIFMPPQVKTAYLVGVLTYLQFPEKAVEMLSFKSKKKQKLLAMKQQQQQLQGGGGAKRRKLASAADELDINDDKSAGLSGTGLSGVVRQIVAEEYPMFAGGAGGSSSGAGGKSGGKGGSVGGSWIASSSSSGSSSGSSGAIGSAIVFVNSCQRCEELSRLLAELGFTVTALHSVMTQDARIASIHKFKSFYARILVATDVASRGLDIPEVDLVVNADLPPVVSDYVHRIGRTGRAGRAGRSISLIAPFEIDIVHAIESHTGIKMTLADMDIAKDEGVIVPYLNPVSKALRIVQLALLEGGFEDKLEVHKERKKAQAKAMKKKAAKLQQSHA